MPLHISSTHSSPRDLIRAVPNYPKPGITFRDITPLLADGTAFQEVISFFSDRYYRQIDKVAAIEARGFIFGAALAMVIGAGFIPVRKPGKLPLPTARQDYALEYGTGTVEVHQDAIQKKDEAVLVIDDILATGGTATAAIELIERLGGVVVECAFVVELKGLGGRQRIEQMGKKIYSLYTMGDGQ